VSLVCLVLSVSRRPPPPPPLPPSPSPSRLIVIIVVSFSSPFVTLPAAAGGCLLAGICASVGTERVTGSARQRCASASFQESRECSREEKGRATRRKDEGNDGRGPLFPLSTRTTTRRWELFPRLYGGEAGTSHRVGLVLTPRRATDCVREVHRPLRSLRYPRPTVTARREKCFSSSITLLNPRQNPRDQRANSSSDVE
jgi:hypothetical protein